MQTREILSVSVVDHIRDVSDFLELIFDEERLFSAQVAMTDTVSLFFTTMHFCSKARSPFRHLFHRPRISAPHGSGTRNVVTRYKIIPLINTPQHGIAYEAHTVLLLSLSRRFFYEVLIFYIIRFY